MFRHHVYKKFLSVYIYMTMNEIFALALCCMLCPIATAQTAGHSTYYTPVGDPSGGWAGNCGYTDLSRKLAGLEAVTCGDQF